jgi:hypothetical protein
MHTLDRLVTVAGIGVAAAFIGGDVRGTPAPGSVPIECTVSKNNDGCETTVSCPRGTSIRSAHAACNLEWGSVSDRRLAEVPENIIEVVRPSDHADEGRCWVGSTSLGEGRATLGGITSQTSVNVGCQEHDQNGGDCQIRGLLRCE